MSPLVPVLPFIFLGALLYSSVGHGGATIYMAILTIAGFAVGPLVTSILVLNIVAAAIGFAAFRRAGHVRRDLLIPFLVTSVPMAYVGGLLPLSGRAQAWILGGALFAGAVRLILIRQPTGAVTPRFAEARPALSPLIGAGLGFLAGTTGIGGGIFLSPILFLLGWATVKEAAGVASAFIVLNSIAGLAAKLPRQALDWEALALLSGVVIAGALIGSHFGARRIPPRALQVLLGVVLLVASVRAVL